MVEPPRQTPLVLLHRVLSSALAAVEPGRAVRSALLLREGALTIGAVRHPIAGFRRVLVVGAGKAAAPMAAAVEAILEPTGIPLTGVVVVPYGQTSPTRVVAVREAAHPLPDASGVAATREIAQLLEGADERDLVVVVLSGGASALLTLPADLSLGDLRETVSRLLASGATIDEMNVVRKHLDQVKGGGLAKLAAPAPLVALVLSDVVGSPLSTIASGPTVPDESTWRSVEGVLDRYGLWEQLPATVIGHVREGLAGRRSDTARADDPAFAVAATRLVGSNAQACDAAVEEARRLGLAAQVLTTFVEGEAREVGKVLAALLREEAASGRPLARPCCLVAGGETTVTLRGSGRGGRNQEVALGAAPLLRGLPGVLLASIGTDGMDGPTDAAGAWVDGLSDQRARDLGLSIQQHLAANNAYPLLAALGSLIQTGPTNTNVNDLYLLFAF